MPGHSDKTKLSTVTQSFHIHRSTKPTKTLLTRGRLFCAQTLLILITMQIHAGPLEIVSTLPAGAQIGWAIRDAANDSLLDGRSADKNFIPGSIQKLFTTWIALDLLGADKTFVTEILFTGSLKGDSLQGNLILKGGGDPSFGDAQFAGERSQSMLFNAWLLALKKVGLRKINGCVDGDGSYLVEEGPNPAMLWEDAGNYYAGTVSGLSFNGNLYTADFTGAASRGKPVSLQNTRPMHTGIQSFQNHLLTGLPDGKDSAFILGGFPSPVRELRGTYPAGRMSFSIKGSLPNPAWTCAREFQDFLITHGISISRGKSACGDSSALPNRPKVVTGQAIPGTKQISPPLSQLIRHTNQKSDNNYAAQLLALIGKSGGQTGDWRGGLLVVNAYLDRLKLSRNEIHLKDGNGLSRYNWISPRQITQLLAYASRQKAFPEFRASLTGSISVGNDSGIEPKGDVASKLDRYGKGWQGKLWIKTGTLEGVSTLAGYVQARSGRMLAFTVMANNFTGKGNEMQKAFGALLQDWAAKY